MQYPQIQFYRGSLVRLASGRLKQVEDLSSDDFLESARLAGSLDLNNNCHLHSPTMDTDHTDEDTDAELDVVSSDAQPAARARPAHPHQLYIDSSVVRDFLEVGPPPCSTSPASSTGSLHPDLGSLPSTSSASSSSSTSSTSSLPISPAAHANQTVLIKFFLETSRSIAFIEVPIEHPFFVFHRGWSSWNPQRTYDKFGLKCRKLKIGDTCISLIRRQLKQANNSHNQQQESDQCNILFSSIKIHE